MAAWIWIFALAGPCGGAELGSLPGTSLRTTGGAFDLAIDGDGYFLVRSPSGGRPSYSLTRYGALRIDENGNLVTGEGGLVLGFSLVNEEPEPINFPGPGWIGGDSAGRILVSIQVEPNGEVVGGFSDGSVEVVARIGVVLPARPDRLRRISDWNFDCADCGPVDLPSLHGPGEGGAGTLRHGVLELPQPGLSLGTFDRTAGRREGSVLPVPVLLPRLLCVHLEGPGGLTVRDPATDQEFVTRDGLIKIDSEGWLVTLTGGYRVRGFSEAPFPGMRDLRVPMASSGSSLGSDTMLMAETASIDGHGFVTAYGADGGIVRLGRVKLGPFPGSEAVGPTWIRSGRVDPACLDEATLKALNHRSRFVQRPIEPADSPMWVAIAGSGFFLVRTPEGERLLTRSGRFRRQDDGSIVTEAGWPVQAVREAWGDELEDLRVAPSVENVSTEPAGDVRSRIGIERVHEEGDGSWVDRLALAQVVDPSELVEVVPNHFRLVRRAGALGKLRWSVPRRNGMGAVFPGFLEVPDAATEYFPSDLPSRARQIVLWGLQGRAGRIQVSEDLSGWKDWLSFRDSFDGLRFTGLEPAGGGDFVGIANQVFDPRESEASRFYRIVIDAEADDFGPP
ncbi:MAG: hypothetical protein AB7O66_04715 [Limisphaerales bacterium]